MRRAEDDEEPTWVEVWGSPFFNPGRREPGVQRTFAVIRPAKEPKVREPGAAKGTEVDPPRDPEKS
ncbi:MAG: hypothetical protein H6722_26365 [Sandaracinus sp.]|nr:hypothetical protein [Sandaracinus sp.]MCB9621863.1 hypothetical protein [Sandaracinus sp.]